VRFLINTDHIKAEDFSFLFPTYNISTPTSQQQCQTANCSLVAVATAETADFIHKKNKFKEHKETMKLNSLESSRESPVVLCASATAT